MKMVISPVNLSITGELRRPTHPMIVWVWCLGYKLDEKSTIDTKRNKIIKCEL